MATLKSQLGTDSVNFLSVSEFGESITYTPYQDLAKTIKAIVDRNPEPKIIEHGGKPFKGNRIELFIANHSTNGVTSVKKGFDRVELPLIEGGDNVTFRITKVLNSDPGMWHLEAEA